MTLLGSAWLVQGCAASVNGAARYADVLQSDEPRREAVTRVRAPSPDCRQKASDASSGTAELLEGPLPAELASQSIALVEGLHPTAQQVVRRLDSIWYAREIPGADARFVPCHGSDGDRGLVLLDVHSSLPPEVSDVDVPWLYWRHLGVAAPSDGPSAGTVPLAHPGTRYVLLHELGHALSLLAGEFRLDSRGQFDVGSWEGFVGYSWRGTLPLARGRALHEAGGVVPARLALGDWQRLRTVLDSEPSWLAPRYGGGPPQLPLGLTAGPGRLRSEGPGRICEMVRALPRAGFVTPTAAAAPTEDYAEMFAHAILADEGRIRPDEGIVLRPQGCFGTEEYASPYFANGVSEKRAYLERMLGLGTAERARQDRR